MIFKLIKDSRQKEILVQILFSEHTVEVDQIIKKLQSEEIKLDGIKDERKYKVKLSDIFYIESIDKKTFLYCQDDIFQCSKRLYEILDECKGTKFAQISKACIVNLNELLNIKTLSNSRWEATLSNGEKLLVSRKFIPEIHKKISDF